MTKGINLAISYWFNCMFTKTCGYNKTKILKKIKTPNALLLLLKETKDKSKLTIKVIIKKFIDSVIPFEIVIAPTKDDIINNIIFKNFLCGVQRHFIIKAIIITCHKLKTDCSLPIAYVM